MRLFATFCLAIALFAGAGERAGAADATITVTAGYHERMAPPPDAVLEVTLADVSRADAPAVPISSQRFAVTSIPMTVTLSFDPALIDERMSYAVSASLLLQNKRLFRSDTAAMVLTRGAPSKASLTMRRLGP